MGISEYPSIQNYFNNCLKEWYRARRLGELFYYALPGLVFTHVGYKRTPPHINKLVDTLEWFFKDNLNNALTSAHAKFAHSAINTYTPLNILHIGPDKSAIKRIVAYSHKNAVNQSHTIFTNSYHTEFLSLIESSRFYDVNQYFSNLRLVTGSYCTFHLIFYQQLFHCAILYITKMNYKFLLRLNVIRSLHKSLFPFCKILFVTCDPQISQILSYHADELHKGLDCKDFNPLVSLLRNLNNKFVPEFLSEKYFTGVNLQGMSTLLDKKFYSFNGNIALEDDFFIADYMYNDYINDKAMIGNKFSDFSNNLSERFCYKYCRIDKNIPNLRLSKPISL